MRSRWDHNTHYHAVVLAAMPSPCVCALDVGCGAGELTRKLAVRCERVIGVDRDQAMVDVANRAGESLPNVGFLRADFLTYPFAAGGFDFVTAVATLHHLPLEEGLGRMRELLAPGGTLAIVGLYRPRRLSDYLLAAVAWPLSRGRRLVCGGLEQVAPMRGPGESFEEIRGVAERLMPGVECRRGLFFRYVLVWRKGVGGEGSALSG